MTGRVATLALLAVACRPPITAPDERLNVVVVLADDLRHDVLFAMPTVEGMGGVRFTRAYIPNPMCCPSRASLLTGGFDSHETGVLTNDDPNGGAAFFPDADTLGTRLQGAGYATGYVGKYLNHYEDLGAYVPPGWTSFHGMTGGETYHGWSAVEGSSDTSSSTGTVVSGDEYLTDAHRDAALAFLDQAEGPFFLLFSTYAPHAPFEPAPEDEGAFAGLEWRAGAFGEVDLGDKPAIVQGQPPWSEEAIASHDRDVQRQLETLRSLDRAVSAIVERLEALGVADRTVVIFTSDNGYLWGEHRLRGKGWMYEESVRVPLIVRWPGGATGEDARIVAANLDVGATVAEIAGVPVAGDGASLVPVMAGDDPSWREALLLENYTRSRPMIAGAVSRDHKALLHPEGTWEVYDLVADPYEEQALSELPAEAEPLRRLIEGERGLLLLTNEVHVTAGVPIQAPLEVVGGEPPYQFALEGRLPRGLRFLPQEGRIEGLTHERGRFVVRLEVTDSSVSRVHGGPQVYVAAALVEVDATRAAPEVTVEAEARSARLRVVNAPKGALVEISADPTFDGARRIGPFAGEGPFEARVDGLVADRTYAVRVVADGLEVATATFRTRP